MVKVNNFLDKNIEKIILYFLLFQPIIDLITSFMVRFSSCNITFGILIRSFMLLVFGYYFIFLSKSKFKKKSLMYLFLLVLYMIIFVINIFLFKGPDVFFLEFKGLFKYFYFPLMFIILFDIFTFKKFKFKLKNFLFPMFLYILFIFLGVVTNTGVSSYRSGRFGSSGWFYAANEIGSILACLFPIILFYAIEYKNKKKNYLFLFSFIVISFLVGTKVPFLGILISLVCAGLFYFLKYIFTKNKKNIFVLTVPIIFIASLMIIILPYTPVGKNLNLHFKLVNVKEFSDFFDDDSDDDAMNVIYSSRNIFLENTKRNFYNAPLYRRFFGIGFVEEYSKEDQHYKAIEMDFHDIFFRFGFFGFLIYFSFVIFVCFKIFFKFLKNIKKQILNFKYILFLISILLILGIAFIAGHVFSAPAVSIYLVFFLNCLNAMFWEESFNEECLD